MREHLHYVTVLSGNICLPDKVYKGLVEPPKTLIFHSCQLICVTFQTFSRHPLTPEVDSGMTVSTPFPVSPNKIVESPSNTNVPAPADSTKSPNMCLSPGLSPFASRAETPGVVNNSPGWSQGFQQGLDAAARQIHQGSQPRLMRLPGQGAESAARPFVLEAKLEPLSRGLERDELGDDSDVIVPVIISLGDKSKSSVTKEVQLKDIINGTTCTLEGKDYSMPWWKRAVSDNLLTPPPPPSPLPKISIQSMHKSYIIHWYVSSILHFVLWSIKLTCKDFTRIYRAENLTIIFI